MSSIESERGWLGKGIGGSSCGDLSRSRSIERPSSVESETRGRPSGWSDLSGTGGGCVDVDDLDPCVLLLNLDGITCPLPPANAFPFPNDTTLSLFRIILFLARPRTFFSALGKNSVRCVVISSLGGRWPKKLRSFEGRLEPLGLRRPEVGEGGSRARSGLLTPRPLRMLMELARLVLRLVTLEGLPARSSMRRRRRRVRPFSRVGWSGA